MSTRIITAIAGNVVGTADQLPFGEEIGFTGESETHNKFTSYERDGTGLHYAVNRHYDSRQGRFNQVDPLGLGASSLADPQSLNLYGYVRNDPVNAVDPIGLRVVEVSPYGFGGSPAGSGFFIDGVPVSAGFALSYLNNGFGVVVDGAGEVAPSGVYGDGSIVVANQFGPGIDGGYEFIGQQAFFDSSTQSFPLFTADNLKTVNKSLGLAQELASKKKCDEALKNYGIPSLAALVNQYNVNTTDANIFDGRKSTLTGPIGQNGATQSIGDYFKEQKGQVGAAVFGNSVTGRGSVTFLGDYFFNPVNIENMEQQRGIILLHEAVHQFGGKGDSVFGGSKKLSELIIEGCAPVLKGKLGGVG
jgi:RHS repeat-associated protein